MTKRPTRRFDWDFCERAHHQNARQQRAAKNRRVATTMADDDFEARLERVIMLEKMNGQRRHGFIYRGSLR